MKQFKADEVYWELAEKILNGSITPEELAEFTAWYNHKQDEPVEISRDFAGNSTQLKRRILTVINSRKTRPKINVSLISRYTAAACLILFVLLAGLYFSLHNINNLTRHPARMSAGIKQVIMPGTNKAILSLANGSEIILDSSKNGTISNANGAIITKVDGRLTCKAGLRPVNENILNTIKTPKGGQYQVILSDGTAVWLNAASSLSFPATFAGMERRVALNGEAYFEVARHPGLPFIIEVNDMTISVLGTHFNVKAYADENTIKTTLLKGSVELKKQHTRIVLQPGEEASTDSNSGFQVHHDIDLNQAVAWKNGLFEFDDPIEDIMRQISRWYDVAVVYEGRATGKSFSGTIARKKNIEEVLHLLEMTGSIHFKIEGRSVRVMP